MVEAAGRDHDEFRMPPGTRSADGGGAALVETPEGEPLQLEVALGGDPSDVGRWLTPWCFAFAAAAEVVRQRDLPGASLRWPYSPGWNQLRVRVAHLPESRDGRSGPDGGRASPQVGGRLLSRYERLPSRRMAAKGAPGNTSIGTGAFGSNAIASLMSVTRLGKPAH